MESSRIHFEVLDLGLEDLFFWRALALVFLVVGLEHSYTWLQKDLCSIGLSLALASSIVSSTPPMLSTNFVIVSVNLNNATAFLFLADSNFCVFFLCLHACFNVMCFYISNSNHTKT